MSLTTLDKQDIKVMIDESIQSSPIIRTMSSDIKRLELSIENLDLKTGVMFEDLDSKIDTVIEIVSDNADVKKQVKNHEGRLTGIEAVQPLISKTLALHSKQLGAK